jgi:hypothetical protein
MDILARHVKCGDVNGYMYILARLVESLQVNGYMDILRSRAESHRCTSRWYTAVYIIPTLQPIKR